MPQNATAYAAGEALLLGRCDGFQPDALLLSQFCFGALPVDVPKIVVAHSDVLSWADAVGKAPLADDAWLRTYCALVQRGLDGADAVVAPTRAMLDDLRRGFHVPEDVRVIANGVAIGRAASARETWDSQQEQGERGCGDSAAGVEPTSQKRDVGHHLSHLHLHAHPDSHLHTHPDSHPDSISHSHSSRAGRKLQAIVAGRVWDEAKNICMLQDVVSPMHLLVAGEHRAEQGAFQTVSRVEHAGRCGPRRPAGDLSESAVYICSSVYEPFGLAPLEAALCGCAVLANDIPSLREVWGDAALYFRDAASLSALLARLCHSPDELAQAQARSYRHAGTYTAARMAEQYIQLIERVTADTMRSEAHAA